MMTFYKEMEHDFPGQWWTPQYEKLYTDMTARQAYHAGHLTADEAKFLQANSHAHTRRRRYTDHVSDAYSRHFQRPYQPGPLTREFNRLLYKAWTSLTDEGLRRGAKHIWDTAPVWGPYIYGRLRGYINYGRARYRRWRRG
jgi:hypothetical protein